jgi:hypothetical protein
VEVTELTLEESRRLAAVSVGLDVAADSVVHLSCFLVVRFFRRSPERRRPAFRLACGVGGGPPSPCFSKIVFLLGLRRWCR